MISFYPPRFFVKYFLQKNENFYLKQKIQGSRRVARTLYSMAASPGLEPRLTESESAVLPLDDEAIICAVSVL